MQEAFNDLIHQDFPFLKESKLLIAVSGGVDSVVLTHLCSKLKLNIALAHCNFNLRGEESDYDEAFVLNLGDQLDLEVFIEKFDTQEYAESNKLSIQMAARALRYSWFNELAKQLKFDYILTAHHADDNLETFLINLSRGTGLEGLVGIPKINKKIVRPLLSFSREDIEIYARSNNIEWKEDSSNASSKYLRNALRHDVVPKLKSLNTSFLQNFNTSQEYLNEAQSIVEDAVRRVKKKVVSVEGNRFKFNIKKLNKLTNKKAYLYQLLKEYNFTQWNDIADLLDAQSGKQIFSETHRLLKDRDYLLLSEINSEEVQPIIISNFNESVQTHLGMFTFNLVDGIQENSLNTIYLDKDKLEAPLTLRQWKQGDYFYPMGMQGKKKVSKYFKDEKLSLLDKENVWLLCSNGNIVWVVNRRGDDRFKITDSTKQILKIELH